ncbi:uncharacterized protein LOC128985296 [Macrosteles quadrilineatus]|uniref:uncharacterized protein LOC128985296 n=1 Tax=Macrosteles quadrilineatus TaxID=74068 RepID=UPI0023E27BF9|nr:uncharacterized protein LOC128985296 [Macrosteles quadrilineatus]
MRGRKETRGDEPRTKTVIGLLKSFGLYTTCTEPTRGPSCLDNIATNFTVDERGTKVVDPGGNDHAALVMSVSQPNSEDRFREDNEVATWRMYLALKKLYKGRVELAKKVYNAKCIEEAPNRCKAAWDLVNIHRTTPKREVVFASPDDFNNFFCDSVRDIVDRLPPCLIDPVDMLADRVPTQDNLRFNTWRLTTPESIKSIVGSFKPSTSQDVYGMSPNLIKTIIDEIAAPLSFCINECLDMGFFSDSQKVSKTVPVFKKGEMTSLSSYRPIFIVPVFGKVMEAVIKPQVENFFEGNRLLTEMQFGFRRGKSTAAAVAAVAERVSAAFEDHRSTALTLCDLSRAFDTVSHEVLLKKLSFYGLDGVVLSTLRSYLLDRTQLVTLAGASSSCRAVEHGVPQGSILGPLLFIIMMNDLDDDGGTLLFADDTTLLSSGSNLREINEDMELRLRNASAWFVANRFQLNPDKTQRMVCSLAHIPPVDQNQVKLLGIVLNNKLCWDQHIDQTINRLSRVCALLLKLRSFVTEDYLKMVYFALFHCHVTYGLLLWGHSPGTVEILTMQKRALRIITFSDGRAHGRPLFKRLGIPTVFGHYILLCLLHVWDKHRDLTSRAMVHSYNTRQRNMLDVPRVRLSKTAATYQIQGLKFFNKLPMAVRDWKRGYLKDKLMSLMKERAYYSISEFMTDKEIANIRHDRDTVGTGKSRGGGVLLAVHRRLQATQLTVADHLLPVSIDSLSLVVRVPLSNFLLYHINAIMNAWVEIGIVNRVGSCHHLLGRLEMTGGTKLNLAMLAQTLLIVQSKFQK